MLATTVSSVFTVIGGLCIAAWTFFSRKARRMPFKTVAVAAILSFVIFKIILAFVIGYMTNVIDPVFDHYLEILGGGFDAWH